MLAEELKKSVLQAAIRGKLVEQQEDEGDADTLLNKIQEERASLVKNGVIKKTKSLPSITDEEIPFEIPQNWRWVRLGEVVSFKIGKTPPRKEPIYWGNDYPWISIADMVDGAYISQTKESISQYGFEKTFNSILSPKGTLIMSFKLTVGKVSILDVDAIHNEAIISIFPYLIKDNIMRDYLFKTLPLLSTFGDFKEAIKGKTLNRISLSNLLIPLPPLSQQKRIVEEIEVLMTIIKRYEDLEVQHYSLKQAFPGDLKKSILQAAMQGKLVEQRESEGCALDLIEEISKQKERLIKEKILKHPVILSLITEEEIPFDIPTNWQWVRLGDLATINGGYAFKSQNFKSKGVRVIRISDFDESGFKMSQIVRHEFDEAFSTYLIEEKNILLCMTGGTVGKSLFVQKMTERMMTNQRVATIKINPILIEEYINYVILSPLTQQVIASNKNSTNDNISMDCIRKFLIPLPPLAEQKRIVEKLDQLLPLCDNLIGNV